MKSEAQNQKSRIKKILIVDDNEDNRVLQETVLKGIGFTVEAAANGVEALEIALRFSPDIIVSDVLMPEMDGFDLCRAVKSDERLQDIPFVIYSSSYVGSRDRELALALGATRYIVKPMEIDEFTKEIEDILKKHKMGKFQVSELPKMSDVEMKRTHEKILVNKLSEKVSELEEEITKRKKAEIQISRQSTILDAINKIFKETLTCDTEEEVAKTSLVMAQELTDSKFGFYGEINKSGLFDTIAMSDPGWDACRIPETDAVVLLNNMKIHGIYGSILKGEKSQIVNDTGSHPDRIGLPEGHPPLTSFLGVPLKQAGKTIGMIALANKEGSYTPDDQNAIEALSVAFVEALMSKRAESELLEKEEKLRISYKMASLGRLTSGVFHELLNPVNIISSHVQLLLMETEKGSKTEEDLKSIQEEIKRVVKISDGLLKFARKGETGSEQIKINDLLDNIISIVEPDMKLEEVIFNRKFDDRLPQVTGSSDQLRQVFLNLITNARDAMPEGGTITVKTRIVQSKEFRVGSLESGVQNRRAGEYKGDFIEISFADTGCGISKENQEMIFDPFFTTKAEGKGTGLGLSTSFGIIDDHGGVMSVESEVGKGTTFIIDLPAKN